MISDIDLQGTITYSPDSVFPYEVGTTALYECDLRYQATGTGMRVCEDTMTGSQFGDWSGNELDCVFVTGEPFSYIIIICTIVMVMYLGSSYLTITNCYG